jgi:uncharacterized protein (DUF1697 family)
VVKDYVALLRGINVGTQRRVEMKRLKNLFESLGFANVSTYINSGNVLFGSNENLSYLQKTITARLGEEFGFEIPTLIKTKDEIKAIVDAIPQKWQNNDEQRSDVAFLFAEIDYLEILDELPINKELVDIRYVQGAVFWNIERKNYNKSHLNKLIKHKTYQLMTIRNVNTTRILAW